MHQAVRTRIRRTTPAYGTQIIFTRTVRPHRNICETCNDGQFYPRSIPHWPVVFLRSRNNRISVCAVYHTGRWCFCGAVMAAVPPAQSGAPPGTRTEYTARISARTVRTRIYDFRVCAGHPAHKNYQWPQHSASPVPAAQFSAQFPVINGRRVLHHTTPPCVNAIMSSNLPDPL